MILPVIDALRTKNRAIAEIKIIPTSLKILNFFFIIIPSLYNYNNIICVQCQIKCHCVNSILTIWSVEASILTFSLISRPATT